MMLRPNVSSTLIAVSSSCAVVSCPHVSHLVYCLWLLLSTGFFVVCTLLELLLRVPGSKGLAIVYKASKNSNGGGSKTRQQLATATQIRIPFWKQVGISHHARCHTTTINLPHCTEVYTPYPSGAMPSYDAVSGHCTVTHTKHTYTGYTITRSPQPCYQQSLLAALHVCLLQVRGCVSTLAGPQCIVNGCVMSLIMTWAKPDVTSWWPESAAGGVLQFFALVLVADFGLYWGKSLTRLTAYCVAGALLADMTRDV